MLAIIVTILRVRVTISIGADRVLIPTRALSSLVPILSA